MKKPYGMLASQLIHVLQQGIEKYGDCPVFSEADWDYIGMVEFNKDLFGYRDHPGEGEHFVLHTAYVPNPDLEIYNPDDRETGDDNA